MAEVHTEFSYRNIELYKSESLGSGSYGGVCKTKCDGLLCAAKIMHPTLFDLRDPGTASYLRKFREECHLLSLARHPNVVQYLGTYTDPDTRLPVLLMELCDESLTAFLERSPGPLSYHIQLNIIHDIALALVYLHSNGLIHRDLTGNNVLMIPGPRAKITDFGMSKLVRVDPRMTALTLCPGNLLYMSPEALDEAKVYTNKLDIFSFGVIVVQILTRQFPNPTDRFRLVSVPQFKEPLRQEVPETERRQAHLRLIPDSHALKPLALQCLKTNETRRPSALQLNGTLSELKTSSLYYSESMEQTQSVPELERALRDKDRQLEHAIATRDEELQRKEGELQQTREMLQASRLELLQLPQQIHADNHPYPEPDVTAPQEISSMTRKDRRDQLPATTQLTPEANITKKQWTERNDAPEAMCRGAAVVHGNTVYFRPAVSDKVYSYRQEQWSQMPENPNRNFGITVIDGLLTSVGGRKPHPTNTLLSFRGKVRKQWSEVFPPMPTPRSSAVCVTTEQHLVVAGGLGDGGSLDIVEVMNINSKQWTTASPLPMKCMSLSAALIEDTLYLAGGMVGDLNGRGALMYRILKNVFTCSFSDLISPPKTRQPFVLGSDLWKEVKNLPVTRTTLVSFSGDLLAIGGDFERHEPTSNVYRYDSHTNTWNVASQMKNKRSTCLVINLPEDYLIVVGGYKGSAKTNSVEFLH